MAGWSWRSFLGVATVALALFALRLCAPPNLLGQDQENPGAYVLDAVKNGHWTMQTDFTGHISSKPPVYTWLAALVTLACGRISLFSLYLPGALALLATSVLVLSLGREHFGPRTGLFGALAGLLCIAGTKQLGLARTDGVFAFTVTATAILAYRAWMRGRGWTWFWLMAAIATLTKGPLGLALGAGGLLACWWEGRSGDPIPLRGSHTLGIACFISITVGWIGLALWQLGYPVWDKLFVQEFLFHIVEGEQKKAPGTMFYLSPLYYLARSAPWSLFAYLGLWRIWKSPSLDKRQRRFERFLFCWFTFGLVLFSLAPHQRGDLLWPIMPAGALIAGIELARLTRRMDAATFNRRLVIFLILALAGFSAYYFGPRGREPICWQTLALEHLAVTIREQGGEEFPLTHTDDPAAFQVYLNTCRRPVSFERAAALLREPDPAFVAVTDWAAFQALRKPEDPPWHVVLDDNGPVAQLRVRVVSNRADFKLLEAAAFAFGPWVARYQGHLRGAWGDRLAFAPGAPDDRVSVTNQGQQPRTLQLRVDGRVNEPHRFQPLLPGQSATFPLQ